MGTDAPNFLFAGGGTGGHIFPALAIAEQVRLLRPGAGCRFLCSSRPIDHEILSRETLSGAPVEFRALPAQPFGIRPRVLWRFVSNWGAAVRESREDISRARRDGARVALAALGGFVAAPAVQAARVERIPVLMVNLDAVPGRANRWIARHATRVLTAASIEPAPPGRVWEVIPPVVRAAATARGSPQECRMAMGLPADASTLLVTGASQGAGSMNRFLASFSHERPGALRGWQVIHQTGPGDVDEVRAAYARAGVPARVEPFFREMGLCWGAADLAVSRAGAGSVAEAWSSRVPTLFMPYPFHRDQHQRRNAAPLERAGGAIVVRDHVEPGPNLADAGIVLAALLADAPRRARMREALLGLGETDGATRAARALLGLAESGV